MTPAPALTSRPLLEWGAAQAELHGETVCGDRYLVRPFQDGVLVTVIDGLGHGAEAAEAAELAITTMAEYASEPAIRLIMRCHEALRSTRGAAMSLATFNTALGAVTWLGVGNVEGVIIRADKQAVPPRENVMLFPGVAGHQLPSLRAVVTGVNSGDLLVFFTDGIRRDFLSEPIIPGHSPQRMADRICSQYSKGTDDALVLVARYLGGSR